MESLVAYRLVLPDRPHSRKWTMDPVKLTRT